MHLAWSNQTADGTGTITGGLTNFAPPTGYYAPDHDQRNTLNAGFDADLRWQSFAAMNLYYGSGFSNSRECLASVTVLNVANRHLLIDNSLTFDGFHWNDAREIYAEVRYRFHY